MKKQPIRIAFTIALIGLIGLSQVGANFLHDPHDAHAWRSVTPDEDSVIPHGEHCKLCAIDLFSHAFEKPEYNFLVHRTYSFYFAFYTQSHHVSLNSFTSGRAPPQQS